MIEVTITVATLADDQKTAQTVRQALITADDANDNVVRGALLEELLLECLKELHVLVD